MSISLMQRGLNAIDVDADEEIIMVSVHDVNVSAGEEVFATTIDYITFAQVLEEMKSIKPKKKRVVIQELGEYTTTISSQLSLQQSHDKGKGILIEHVKPMNKKDLIRLDEETALNLQAEFDEEERLAREKAEKEEANIALIKTWDDIQARLMLIINWLKESKRAEEKRNKPPTKAQQRKIMCTYLKNMEGYKLKDLKLKEFDSIQEMFDRAFKRVNTFEDFRTELVEDEDEVAIDVIPLVINQMLKSFNKEDLEDLDKLVKAKYESTRPVEDLDLLLWGDLKTIFEPHVEDKIYMLVEKKYPLAPLTLSMMLEKKLMIDYESEMAYQLLKFIINSLRSKEVFGSILLVLMKL
ncbi:hypothetical protein Tco_1410672 [Tanacetum coccineum]